MAASRAAPSRRRAAAPEARPGWRCPACGRRFEHRNQAHSCATRSIASFFAGHPALRPLFDQLLARIARLGPVHVDASPSGINIAARSHFAGVKPTRDGLRVGFVLRGKREHPRIIGHEPVGGGRHVHRVLVRSRRDLDAELIAWLREAYALNAAPAAPG